MKRTIVTRKTSLAESTQTLLNQQVGMESNSSSYYLAAASWCEKEGYENAAAYLYRHAEEERSHMMKIFQYINQAGGHALAPSIGEIRHHYASLREVFEEALEHELARVLTPDGDLLFVVPVGGKANNKSPSGVKTLDGDLLFVVPVGGKAKIMFNAHRIYQPKQIIKLFQAEGLVLKEFTMIPEEAEDGALVQNPVQKLIDKQEYACGCFWFSKT